MVEARGRTFDHLFLIGAARGVFPRAVRTDPLLPDDLRAALAPVLPDLPRKAGGFDEERHLFAELLSASPRVVVSWQSRDDEGRPLATSPLVERLAAGPAPAAPSPLARDGALRGPRPAREAAVVAALGGAARAELVAPLAVALAAGRAEISPTLDLDAGALASVRVRVLDELDPDLRDAPGRATASGLGPFFGFVGPRGGAHDPRPRDLWVTQAERLAGCPWQLFLERLLRIEPTPDPLEALPGTDALLLGNVVHAVLEEMVTAAGGGPRPLAECAAAPSLPVPFFSPTELAERVRRVAGEVLADEGIPLPGLAAALAQQALPLVEAARRLDWPADGPLDVLAAEAEGAVAVAAAGDLPARRVGFKADRVDRAGGALRLTDYKTGRPLSDAKAAATRHQHHLAAVRTGRNLQAVAYQLAAAACGDAAASGRYLYLRPEVGDPELAAGPDDADLRAAFAATVGAVYRAWDGGAFFPRVVDPAGEREPSRCNWCKVAEACLRGDSGARRRLHRFAAETAREDLPGDAERALVEVWWLADPKETSR